MENPYTSRGPLHEARMFFGRTAELNEIGSFLRGNQSVSVVGPHKIGKTSLMLHLMRQDVRAALGIGEEYLFVYIDCHMFSGSRQDEITSLLCIEIAAALQARSLEPEPSLQAVNTTPTWFAFEFALRKLNQRGLRVVLILDDFEQLSVNPSVNVTFYNALRSVAGRLRLAFLTGSAQPLVELTYFEPSKIILSSPFFNIFAQLFLGLLPESEARNLIRNPMVEAGVNVSSRLEDFIYELVGGHPLALQIAGFHAWVNPEDLDQIKRMVVQELDEHFQQAWCNLSPAERDVLCHPVEAGLQEAGHPILALALRDLTRKCLLDHSSGSYRYPSRAWAEFVSVQPHDRANELSIV